jgi:hypothetical protein
MADIQSDLYISMQEKRLIFSTQIQIERPSGRRFDLLSFLSSSFDAKKKKRTTSALWLFVYDYVMIWHFIWQHPTWKIRDE